MTDLVQHQWVKHRRSAWIAATFAARQSDPAASRAGSAVSGGGGLSSLTNPGDGGAENIADAAHRADERGAIGAAGQLLAQSCNQRVDRTIKIGPFAPSQRAEQSVSR